MAERREVAWLVGWWSGGAGAQSCWLESGVELLGGVALGLTEHGRRS